MQIIFMFFDEELHRHRTTGDTAFCTGRRDTARMRLTGEGQMLFQTFFVPRFAIRPLA
jgi:hypothetical protein